METLREFRRRRGWSQKDLANESGVGQDTISSIETGTHEPRPSTLRKLAEALDVEVADFFREPALPKAEAPKTGLVDWLRANPIPLEELSEQDRREIERVLAGERPRAYFVEEPVYGEAIASAAEEWLRTVSNPDTEQPMAYGITKAAQDLEDFITVRLGEPGWWEGLSDEERRSITRVSKLLGNIVDQYIARTEAQSEQLAADQETKRRRDEVRERTRQLSA